MVALANSLEDKCIGVIVDNLDAFTRFHDKLVAHPEYKSDIKVEVYVKIDTGYHRAGIEIASPKFKPLVDAVLAKEAGGKGATLLKGFYSHFGHSYGGDSEADAAAGLVDELVGLERAAQAVPEERRRGLVLSIGATPTATAAQNMLSSTSPRV